MTEIALDAQRHYHRRLTETYYFLECGPDALMELDDERIPVKPGLCIMIPPGVRHRAIGRMKVLIVVLPKSTPRTSGSTDPRDHSSSTLPSSFAAPDRRQCGRRTRSPATRLPVPPTSFSGTESPCAGRSSRIRQPETRLCETLRSSKPTPSQSRIVQLVRLIRRPSSINSPAEFARRR